MFALFFYQVYADRINTTYVYKTYVQRTFRMLFQTFRDTYVRVDTRVHM